MFTNAIPKNVEQAKCPSDELTRKNHAMEKVLRDADVSSEKLSMKDFERKQINLKDELIKSYHHFVSGS